MTPNVIVAIDGPAASGKGTIARAVARALGVRYVDTGAVYRALGFLALRDGLSLQDGPAVAALARRTKFELGWDGSRQHVVADGVDISDAIRADEVGQAASAVGAHPEVRDALLELQRQAAVGGVVMDGRDIGTVVLPHADVKVFLDAAVAERARRRTRDLHQRGDPTPYDEVLASLEARDRRDRERAVAPLKAAPDAVVVDTTHLSILEATDAVLDIVRRRVG